MMAEIHNIDTYIYVSIRKSLFAIFLINSTKFPPMFFTTIDNDFVFLLLLFTKTTMRILMVLLVFLYGDQNARKYTAKVRR